MPTLARTRLCLLPTLGALLTLLAAPAQAAMLTLNDQSLSDVSGQDGVTLNLELQAAIGKISWEDDGNSLQVRNLTIDNGCGSGSSCPSIVPFGPAKLYFQSSLVNAPTLKVDVINQAGTQKLQLTLPDLKTTSDQLLADGITTEPLKLRIRIAGELGLGNAGSPGASTLGRFEIRDLTDIQGKVRIWGH
jgi:hypothetical protein